MDVIDTIDWGAYAHFTFVAAKYPEIIHFVRTVFYDYAYVIFAWVIAAMMLLFILRKRFREALVASTGIVAALGTIEMCRLLVPRRRPEDAQELVGAEGMLGSYPSAGVFLFMLSVIYFGFALWPWLRTRVTRGVFLLFAIAATVSVALSEFLLATHFVSDVVGGIVAASIVGVTTGKFMDTVKMPESNQAAVNLETAFRASENHD